MFFLSCEFVVMYRIGKSDSNFFETAEAKIQSDVNFATIVSFKIVTTTATSTRVLTSWMVASPPSSCQMIYLASKISLLIAIASAGLLKRAARAV